MSHTKHFRRSSTGLLFLLLTSILITIPAFASTGTSASSSSGTTSVGSSHQDLRDYEIAGGNPYGKSAIINNQGQKADGTDNSSTYQSQTVAGTSQGGSQMNVTTPTPETVAQNAVPNQTVPQQMPKFNPIGFTICTNPLMNHEGPPKPSDVPFEFIPPFNFKEGQNNNMNPASFLMTPYMDHMATNPESKLTSAISDTLASERTVHQLSTPNFQTSQAEQQGQTQQAGEAVNAAANNQFNSNLQVCQTLLINVANENAGVPYAGGGIKTLPQAIWMVQQVYHHVFLPMAVLLLLPGALATQVMCIVHKGMHHDDSDEIASPFTGILRAMVALFLIPATQLIVSYSIDVGNSMTAAITDQLNDDGIVTWVSGITNPNPNQTPKQKSDAASQQTTVAAMQDMIFGSIQMLASDALMILTSYQVVIACYLLLLGPIAACFFAWPSRVGKLFKPVFSNWMDGLFNLVLWRFWWCVILLCMATRLQWLADIGEPTNGPWERLVFISFQVMLTYVPFMALEFKPGNMVDQLLEKAKGASAKQGSGGTKSMTQHNRGLTTKGIHA